jgi:uncharacterized protein (UPF0210 family)
MLSIARRPDEVDIRAFTLTFEVAELLKFDLNPERAVLPGARREVRKLVNELIGVDCRSGIGIRTVRLSLRGCGSFIKAIVAHHAIREDAAAAWLGRALELLAAAESSRFQREYLGRIPATRAKLLHRLHADSVREIFILVELRGGDNVADERTVRWMEAILSGNPHVFVGFTASTKGRPASSATLQAAAREVHLMGCDAARCGINFQPPENGAFFPGTQPTQRRALSAGIADAQLLADAVRDARKTGDDDFLVEEALVAMHAAVLRIAGEIGQAVAARCGLRWVGISPVSAPVNCVTTGASPLRRSSWAVLEALHGSPVDSANILQATARYNACLWRSAKRSGQKICGFIGSFNPPAEDGLLAQRVREGRITVRDLILQETVCSSGVDMVIVRPETSAAQIAALYAEVASLSDQWDKSLTVRVIVAPRSAPLGTTGDVRLGGLLGEAPTMELPGSSVANAHAVQTVGRLQRRTR